MKRKLLSIALVSFTLSGMNAQITLMPHSFDKEIGDVYSYNEVSSSSLNFSNVGANQTWDLSLVSGTTNASETITALSGMSDASNFSQASYGVLKGVNESFILESANTFEVLGMYKTGDFRLTYTDYMSDLVLPFTYNDAQTDNFSGTYEDFASAISFSIVGTVEYKSDGYGTLILPYTTVNNVLKVETVTTTTSTYAGQSSTVSDTTYSWYSADYKFALANYNKTSTSLSYVTQSSLATKVLELDEIDMIVFPNPVQNVLNITGGSNELDVSIYNLLGEKVYSSVFTSQIDTSVLPRGTYIVKIAKGGVSIYTKKIVKL